MMGTTDIKVFVFIILFMGCSFLSFAQTDNWRYSNILCENQTHDNAFQLFRKYNRNYDFRSDIILITIPGGQPKEELTCLSARGIEIHEKIFKDIYQKLLPDICKKEVNQIIPIKLINMDDSFEVEESLIKQSITDRENTYIWKTILIGVSDPKQ